MSFQESMQKYIRLAEEKAIREQVCEFLDQFLPTDMKQEVKTIKTRHGAITIQVSSTIIEEMRGSLVKEIEAIVEEMEKL